MKLKNKQTGEIGKIAAYDFSKGIFCVSSQGHSRVYYSSLAELCEEWTDYEEPRIIYYIDWLGRIQSVPSDQKESRNSRMSELGNYFDSYEEAELAVEKLKVFKRLKDEGFRFNGWHYDTGRQEIEIKAEFKEFEETIVGQKWINLNLLFSGGEE